MSQQRTFAIIKPDILEQKKQGLLIQRILDEDFTIVAMRQLQMTPAEAAGFYAVHKDQEFFERLCKGMSRGPLIVLVLEADNAVARWREVLGATDPTQAKVGTIRSDFGTQLSANAAHGSDSVENGLIECGYFFSGAQLLT